MKLYYALRVLRGEVIAFVGAGGKTSALIALGHELAEAGWRVLATTTTRIGADQLALMPCACHTSEGTAAISTALSASGFVFVYDHISSGKVYGPGLTWITAALDSLDSDVLLIEADGSRGLPMKAPYAHEPVIPVETSLVVPVVSLSVLGKPLDDRHVYNSEALVERFGFVRGSRVRSAWVAQVLRDESLALKGIPTDARVIGLINQTPVEGYLRGRARAVAQWALRSPRFEAVALGSVRGADPIHEVQRHVGAVVLAAGMSSRMGQHKVLLPWLGNQTILEHILTQLIQSKIDQITVVTGNQSGEVTALVKPFSVQTVFNPAYRTGEMLSSLKAGLSALPRHISAALIVLGDQPRIQPRVVHQVLTTYADGRGEIVAPQYQGQRGHPILIDRRYWAEILDLPDGGAPRDVIRAHPEALALIDVETDSVISDVDTPQDYREQRRKSGIDPD